MNTFNSIDQDIRLKDIISNYENWNLYRCEVLSLKDNDTNEWGGI